jgi:hypothetical protein
MARKLLHRLTVPVCAAGVALAVIVIGALAFWRPYLTTPRDVVTATPSLQGLFQRNVVRVGHDQQACIAPVPFETGTARAQILVNAPRGAEPLVVSASAPGYRASGRVTRYPPGADVPVQVRLTPPSQDRPNGRLCVRNAGRHAVDLVGTAEPRSQSPAVTTLDGKDAGMDAALTLLEARPASLGSRLGSVLGHAAALTGGAFGTWLLWLVGVACVLLVVAGLPLALWSALRDDEAGAASDRRRAAP